MSQTLRPTLAALLGLAALTATGPAAADDGRGFDVTAFDQAPITAPQWIQEAIVEQAQEAIDAAEVPSLRHLIEHRLSVAEQERRYAEIDELTTLWLTLERREQLDRVVERGDQFLNVSLRNQKRSEIRGEVRRHRFAPLDVDAFDVPAPRFSVDEALDAERFVLSLEEPYRSAVLWTLTGRNHREVAEEMDASHAAVRKWAQRLRERLGDD
ncbi:MAG: hypothetical protein KC731_37450 [Myxococcales bacterium]|nr:hypothetical protein [Myxococcales bacterium]